MNELQIAFFLIFVAPVLLFLIIAVLSHNVCDGLLRTDREHGP